MTKRCPLKSLVAAAVAAALYGCANTPIETHVDPLKPQRIEQAMVDGRLQFVMCNDCPERTAKVPEGESVNAASDQGRDRGWGSDVLDMVKRKAERAIREATALIGDQKETERGTSAAENVPQAMTDNGESMRGVEDSPTPQSDTPRALGEDTAGEGSVRGPENPTERGEQNTLGRSEEPRTQERVSLETNEAGLVIEPQKVSMAPVEAKRSAPSAILTQKLVSLLTFGFGSSALTTAALEIAAGLPAALADAEKIVIKGYTDSQGPKVYNDFLARERANEVRKALVQVGVKAEIVVEGEGNCCYVADNATPEGRARNRRVEITIVKANGQQVAMTTTRKE